MPMALPCRLLLPEGDGSRLPADSPGTAQSTAQLLLAQGAGKSTFCILFMQNSNEFYKQSHMVVKHGLLH